MQEKLDALVRTQAMQLFRQQGLHFTMQQVAEPLHISKKTIYTVYPSKEALLLDMVDHAFADIHHCKQKILAGSGTLQEKLRAVIIAMPTEYAALDLRQMKELDEKYPVVAARVRSQLENGWEPTMALLEQAVAEGCKKAMNNGISLPIEKAVEVEEKLFGDCFETHDQQEGMACFLSREKPKPKAVFTNN